MYKLKLERSKDLPLLFFLFNGTVIPLERSAPVSLTIITCNPEGYQSDAMLVFFLINMFTISFKLINSNSEFSSCSFLSYGTNHPFQLLWSLWLIIVSYSVLTKFLQSAKLRRSSVLKTELLQQRHANDLGSEQKTLPAQSGAPDPKTLLPPTEHVEWEWGKKKVHAIGVEKLSCEPVEMPEKSAQREPSTPSTRNRARRLEDILEEREKLGSSQTLENVTRKSGKPGSCAA